MYFCCIVCIVCVRYEKEGTHSPETLETNLMVHPLIPYVCCCCFLESFFFPILQIPIAYTCRRRYGTLIQCELIIV